MVVPEKVQQTVQREHAPLGPFAVPPGARLPAGHATGDDDVAEKSTPLNGRTGGARSASLRSSVHGVLRFPGALRLQAWKREYVGCVVRLPVLPIQRPDARVADEGDVDRAASTARGGRRQPAAEIARNRAAAFICDGDKQTGTLVSRRHD
jgi:hypothetical protein